MSEEENKKHKILKNNIRLIFENCKFKHIDTELQLSFSEDNKPDFKIDVLAIEGDSMFAIECKTGKFDNSRKEIKSIKDWIELIEKDKVVKILSSDRKIITKDILSGVKNVYYGYAFSQKSVFESQKENVNSNNMLAWDNEAVRYFTVVSKTLGNITKYELYREFNFNADPDLKIDEHAVILRQGSNEFYLFSLEPSKLLKIGYVSRRGTRRDESYQRIINEDRLNNIANFIEKSENILMPNPVILAFDKESGEKLEYIKDDHKLFFNPEKYCCAWIVDGQHRIFAFKNINLDDEKWSNPKFKIPVIAFKKLPLSEQSETFVNINYYQKRIENLLIYDLASTFRSLKNELVWPSKLAVNLNEANGPFENLIKISELDTNKPLQITNFVRIILEELLGFNKKTGEYEGPLVQIFSVNRNENFNHKENSDAFYFHSKILRNFFDSVKRNCKLTDEKWYKRTKKNGLLKASTIGGLLFVLSAILWKERNKDIDFSEYLKPLGKINFNSKYFKSLPRGYGAIRGTADYVIKKINKYTGKDFEIKSMSERRK